MRGASDLTAAPLKINQLLHLIPLHYKLNQQLPLPKQLFERSMRE